MPYGPWVPREPRFYDLNRLFLMGCHSGVRRYRSYGMAHCIHPKAMAFVPGPSGANHGQMWRSVGGGAHPPPSVDLPPAAAPVVWLV